ncbi:hypothetical protein [Chryseobacterium sp.]|uniref:hypothetical protein n=1 Tax=Chryseobacterium sp. TaxID=1871047 RepID=UPI002FCAEBE2
MIKLLEIVNLICSLLFFSSGILVYYGILLGSNGWLINFIVGSLFILYSAFNYSKIKTIIKFIKQKRKDEYADKAIIYELISQFFILTISLVFISGIISRVFIEKTAVFD